MEQQWEYEFFLWPHEHAASPSLCRLFTAINGRHRICEVFTEAEWDRFRDDVERAGLTFREVSRRREVESEPVLMC